MCFGAFIDKTLAFEFPHVVGLICFGVQVTEKFPISKDLNKFEQIFGGVIDTESATRLYPSVALAIEKVVNYKKANAITDKKIKSRIICFTDGGGMFSEWLSLICRTNLLE